MFSIDQLRNWIQGNFQRLRCKSFKGCWNIGPGVWHWLRHGSPVSWGKSPIRIVSGRQRSAAPRRGARIAPWGIHRLLRRQRRVSKSVPSALSEKEKETTWEDTAPRSNFRPHKIFHAKLSPKLTTGKENIQLKLPRLCQQLLHNASSRTPIKNYRAYIKT